MINIDKYIEASNNMPNTSDGGSVAYHFDDVVLIKYQCPLKYGVAREFEEQVALEANKKRLQGVRTPAHLAIKRVIDGDNGICWVLQERAKGVSFSKYCYNKDYNVQLKMQSELANAPLSHYEKLVSDVCELYNFGLELKPKNMFYDVSLDNGGFTIIDLLPLSQHVFDPNSLKDVLYLINMLQGIYNCSQLDYYDKKLPEKVKEISRQQYNKIRQNIFLAMEKVIPNFAQHRRSVLRSMPVDVLEYFSQNGVFIGDLTLNKEEEEQFAVTIESIVDSAIRKIASGEYKIWHIYANEIRIDLSLLGMQSNWLYHKSNRRSLSEFNGDFAEYEYRNACAKDLEEITKRKFNEKLCNIALNSSNNNILEAKKEYDEIVAKNSSFRRMLFIK